MNKILELLSQRRIWSSLVQVAVFVVSVFNLNITIDAPVVTDLLSNFGIALAAFVSVVLNLWSYFRPKK